MRGVDYQKIVSQMKLSLENIQNIYYGNLNVKDKHQMLAKWWTDYYKNLNLLEQNNYQNTAKVDTLKEMAFNLYLLGESESYCLDDIRLNYQNTMEEPNAKQILSKGYVTSLEVDLILKYAVWLSWRFIAHYVSDVKINSLNGYCEIAQFLSIGYLESLGLAVTKNTVHDTFQCFKHPYELNHAFGSVEFTVLEDNCLVKRRYLIDPTYKQFFSTQRTNEGMYYKEDDGLKCMPDPGFFMNDTEKQTFSRTLIKNGYILANDKNIKYYGDGFFKASVPFDCLNELKEDVNISAQTYLKEIINNAGDYKLDVDERKDLVMHRL